VRCLAGDYEVALRYKALCGLEEALLFGGFQQRPDRAHPVTVRTQHPEWLRAEAPLYFLGRRQRPHPVRVETEDLTEYLVAVLTDRGVAL